MLIPAGRDNDGTSEGLVRAESGFSLIEMAVVVVIMGIMIGFATVGSLYYMRTQALIGSATRLQTSLRDAQVRAQAEVRTYKVIFDTGNESYEVCRLADSGYQSVERVTLEPGVDLATSSFGTATPGSCTTPPPCPCAFFEPRGVLTDSAGSIVDGAIKIQHTKMSQDRDITIKGLTSRVDVK